MRVHIHHFLLLGVVMHAQILTCRGDGASTKPSNNLREPFVDFFNKWSSGRSDECATSFAGGTITLSATLRSRPVSPTEKSQQAVITDFKQDGNAASATIRMWYRTGQSQPIGKYEVVVLEEVFTVELADTPSHLKVTSYKQTAKTEQEIKKTKELIASNLQTYKSAGQAQQARIFYGLLICNQCFLVADSKIAWPILADLEKLHFESSPNFATLQKLAGQMSALDVPPEEYKAAVDRILSMATKPLPNE